MSSATTLAVKALFDALAAGALLPDAKIPTPLLNERLTTRIAQASASEVSTFLNVLDGRRDQQNSRETLGAGRIGSINGFELVRAARIEWVVFGGDLATRETAFDLGCEAIDDLIRADPTLGGKVDYAEWAGDDRTDHALAGLPQVKAVDITVALTFLSDRPF